MSAFPNSQSNASAVESTGLSHAQFAALATAVAVLGLSVIWPAVVSLWVMWTTDALKSIGMMVPLVSLILILRAWRRLGWEMDGTWWGLPLLLIAIAAVWTQQRSVLLLVVSPNWATALPPPSLVLLAYGSGAVLLIGGVRLYRAALFPILLLWFANPVPHAFSLLVDMPLQTVSAHIARSFAMHLGQPLTPDHLRLMFTPDFGMFIAPGCNGIRGAVTMGFIALIAGYIYRFRWYINGLVVIGAVLLGYVFNLARLCLLVLYYLIALHLTWLQNKAENADYVIGAALFLVATIVLFTVILRFRDARNMEPSEAGDDAARLEPQTHTSSFRYAKLATLATIALFGCVELLQVRAANPSSTATTIDDAAKLFPARLGSYTLTRVWNETLITGPIVYMWGEYAPTGGGTPVAIGVSPMLGLHDPLICHTVRGDHPLWQGELTASTADVPVSFSSAFYSDGATQSLEASTQCTGNLCGEYTTDRTHLGFVYSRPNPKYFLSSDGQHTIPIMVRAETVDMGLSADAARQQLTQDLRTFLSSVNLGSLAQPYGH